MAQPEILSSPRPKYMISKVLGFLKRNSGVGGMPNAKGKDYVDSMRGEAQWLWGRACGFKIMMLPLSAGFGV